MTFTKIKNASEIQYEFLSKILIIDKFLQDEMNMTIPKKLTYIYWLVVMKKSSITNII